MRNMKAIEVLQHCIDQISNMSESEFESIKKQRGMQNKNYDKNLYISDDIEIILPILEEQIRIAEKETIKSNFRVSYNGKSQKGPKFECKMNDNLEYLICGV